MFPDSDIAKKYQCGETKTMYTSCFGLAPHFSQMLEKKVQMGSSYVLLFDESLNNHLQKKQLDYHVRIWEHDRVVTRYVTSDFLGHATAGVLELSMMTNIVEKFGFGSLLQLSMDGPSVNWKLHRLMNEKMQSTVQKSLLDCGSCGLHVCHNAFKLGYKKSTWTICMFLKSLFTLFNEVPARREDAKLSTYPLQFCDHRWVENLRVCRRAREILPEVRRYVADVKSKKFKDPGTVSYDRVTEALSDSLLEAKLAFYTTVAEPIESLLTIYQTDRVMLPFLTPALWSLIEGYLKRFVKNDVLESMTLAQLLSLDFSNSDLHKSWPEIDVGFIASDKLKAVSTRAQVQFKTECKEFLIGVVAKILEKSPITYKLARSLSCLDPENICGRPASCAQKMKFIVQELVKSGHVDINLCDKILGQFDIFIKSVSSDPEFLDFDYQVDNLESLWYSKIDKSSELWSEVIVHLLLLSHGQASVERGFSVNKTVSTTNLGADRLVARRVIRDHVDSVGGVLKVQINAPLLASVKEARQKYLAVLKAQTESNSVASRKRKAVQEEVDQLRKKQKILKDAVSSLLSDADKKAKNAEGTHSTGKMRELIMKSNCLREKAQEKQGELQQVSSELEQKSKELKGL